MESRTSGEVTVLLQQIKSGDFSATEKLIPLVLQELRSLARLQLRRERAGHTLQPTALVNEAYLRLITDQARDWQSRAHFIGVSVSVMRRILIDRARRRTAARHGGGEAPLAIDQIEIAAPGQEDDWLELSDALETLEAVDKQKAEFIKLRYFVGLSLEEAADVLGVSVPTASRWWSYSRAWLAQEIESQRKG